MADQLLHVRVVYLSAQFSWDQWCQLAQGSTLAQALEQSGLLAAWRAEYGTEQSLNDMRVGVWGQVAVPEQIAQDMDRIEVYRELSFDPMESRRRRHAHKLSQKPARPRRQRRAVASA